MSRQTAPREAEIDTAFRSQAHRTAILLIKYRAWAYARNPLTLENVFAGLSCAPPETLIAVAEHLLQIERQAPRRWFGFGGEAPALNAQAVLLLGRGLRRKGGRRVLGPRIPSPEEN